MNTSKSFRGKKKKAIPHYFQKKNTSLSDLLQAASYKRRIRELLKNNKSLAVSLQDAKFTLAKQVKQIEGHACTAVQISHAQIKLKDMAVSIQKLVMDLADVQGFLDVDQRKTVFDSIDRRIRVQPPDHSTIEESASMSRLDLSEAEDSDQSPGAAVSWVKSLVNRKDSMMEVCDLTKLNPASKGCSSKSQENIGGKNQITSNNASIPIQSHLKPQQGATKHNFSEKLEVYLQNAKESPRKPLQAVSSSTLAANVASTFASKIPKVSKSQPSSSCSITNVQVEVPKPIEMSASDAHRRETFVVKPCVVPDVFPSNLADRRGTFVVNNVPQEPKCQSDRRGTNFVPPKSVPLVEEEELPQPPLNDFTEPAPFAETALPNKTILLCEDMELTEVIPTHKPIVDEMPEVENARGAPSTVDNEMEFTGIVPILNLPVQDPYLQNQNNDEGQAVLGKHPSPKENVVNSDNPSGTDCFVKPHVSKSATSLSDKASPVQKESNSSADKNKANSEFEDIIFSQASSLKRKKSHDIDLPDVAKKGRASSMSKRKSVAPKRSFPVSDVIPKVNNRKSTVKKTSKKSIIPKDLDTDFFSNSEDEILADISISNSSSLSKRRTRNKNINFEKYFDDNSFTSAPEPVKLAPMGRKRIAFNETRKSILPKKRTFIFTSKSGTSSAPEPKSKDMEPEIPEDNGVFEFSGSDSESSSNKKPKKAKKNSKKCDSNSQKLKESKDGQCPKASIPHTEKPTPIGVSSASVSPKDIESITFKRPFLSSTSPQTTDESFVIGVKAGEASKVKEKDNLMIDTGLVTPDILTMPLKDGKNKFVFRKVTEGKKAKQVDPTKNKDSEHAVLTKDVLGTTDTTTQSLLHKNQKPKHNEKIPEDREKTNSHPTKLSKAAQVLKSKPDLNHGEKLVPSSSTDGKNPSAQSAGSKFNREDFKTMNLTNNDFVPSKSSKKLFKETQNTQEDALLKDKKDKPKKAPVEKASSKKQKIEMVETAQMDINSDLRLSKVAADILSARDSDAIPIHRQNCSGSIGSLCNPESKENEGRTSRRNRGTKSYKEPSLNVKMRR